ncbi:hypothetical protein BGZ82_002869 [Podila clonocystis]|nr:hypothetical protein BGZ82_002869 [Podila clonocystis]
MDPSDLDESITFVKNGKYFSQLANDLEAAEPSLKGVTALSLAATLNRICQGYHEWDQLTQVETGDTSFKSRLLDLAQELYHLEHDFLKLKQKKSELTAEEKSRLEKATKSRQNVVISSMMQGLNKARKTRRQHATHPRESEDLVEISEDQQHTEDDLDEDDTTSDITTFPDDNRSATPSLPGSYHSTPSTSSSRASGSSRSAILSMPEPPRMYVFDPEAASAEASSPFLHLKRQSMETSIPSKVAKPRIYKQQVFRKTPVPSGPAAIGTEITNLRLNIQKFGEAFQLDKQSTIKRMETLETNLVAMDTKVSTYCSSMGDGLRDLGTIVRAMYNEMQLVRGQLASMEAATLNSIATVKRDVRTLMDQQEQRQVISSTQFLPGAPTVGHSGQYHHSQPPLGQHISFPPPQQGQFWNK